ncbi:MAG: RHS domain-containing protein [Deltaproteobacteria bacterium]|nr:RHS domain-containing protein [Deltaproteobacteria bacterium]
MKLYFIHTDHLGTPIAMTDESGTVVWTHRFDPFGNTLELDEDPDFDQNSLTLNLRFPGQYYDTESGLHYIWHRYYEPVTGRYLQADATGYDSRNFASYEYVASSPLINSDFSGKVPSACKPASGADLARIQSSDKGIPSERNCAKGLCAISYFICDGLFDRLGGGTCCSN